MIIGRICDALNERRIRKLTDDAVVALAIGDKMKARSILVQRDALIHARSPEQVARMEAKLRGAS